MTILFVMGTSLIVISTGETCDSTQVSVKLKIASPGFLYVIESVNNNEDGDGGQSVKMDELPLFSSFKLSPLPLNLLNFGFTFPYRHYPVRAFLFLKKLLI